MPIGNLADKISSSDKDAVRRKNNPSEYEEGFGDDMGEFNFDFADDIDDEGGEDGFDSLDGFGDSNGSSGFDSFGDSSSGFDSFGSGGFDSFGSGDFGSSFGGASTVTQTESKPDTFDIALEAGGEAAKASWQMILEIAKSTKSRNADDWGTLSKNYIKLGTIFIILSIALAIFGMLSGLGVLSFGGLPMQILLSGLLVASTGLVGIGMSAMKIVNSDGARISDVYEDDYSTNDLDDVDVEEDSVFENEDSFGSDTDDEFDSLMADIFNEEEEEDDYIEPEEEDEQEEVIEKADLDSIVSNVPSDVRIITREFLYNTFKPMFPCNTSGFSEQVELDPESDEFANLETLCMKAMAQAAKKDVEELTCVLEQATETKFCYMLKISREKGKINLDDIKNEMEAWFRSGVNDKSVNAVVDIDGGFYSIIISKGETAVVTFGDCFKLKEVENFYLDSKKILPIIAGIDDLGNPILVDAKNYSTMLIAGKPRSGKSWYVDSLVISMMAFNTPEDVQFLIIDPKESYLFKTIALMPHVCGLHNHKNILQILKDIIDLEGKRRKDLFDANRCDDIWAVRKKGIKIPVLYVVIDEFMTIAGDLGKQATELTTLMNTIISQLPSQGIRLLFVPHRAQGVVDKTTRTLVDYIAAVRADNDTVKETLGVNKFNRNLSNPGDTALKLADHPEAEFVRGAAITTSDEDNTELIRYIAKTFYKMGVDIPDMATIGCGFNRDEAYIEDELAYTSNSNRVQYNLDDVSDIDLSVYENKN